MKKLKSLWTVTKLVPLFRLQWIFLTQGWSLRFCIAGGVVIAEPLGRSSVPLFPSFVSIREGGSPGHVLPPGAEARISRVGRSGTRVSGSYRLCHFSAT